MRYIRKQRHATTCGPVALANAFRKLGKFVSYKKALKMCGGLRAFYDKKTGKAYGMSVSHLANIAELNGLEVVRTHISLKEAKWFSKFDEFAVIVAYGWIKRGRKGGHVVTLTKEGETLNGPQLGRRHWIQTRKGFKQRPTVLIVRRKSGN